MRKTPVTTRKRAQAKEAQQDENDSQEKPSDDSLVSSIAKKTESLTQSEPFQRLEEDRREDSNGDDTIVSAHSSISNSSRSKSASIKEVKRSNRDGARKRDGENKGKHSSSRRELRELEKRYANLDVYIRQQAEDINYRNVVIGMLQNQVQALYQHMGAMQQGVPMVPLMKIPGTYQDNPMLKKDHQSYMLSSESERDEVAREYPQKHGSYDIKPTYEAMPMTDTILVADSLYHGEPGKADAKVRQVQSQPEVIETLTPVKEDANISDASITFIPPSSMPAALPLDASHCPHSG